MPAVAEPARALFTAALREARSAGGGFGMARGSAPEAEPTALAAIALDDDDARGWLARAQRGNGGFADPDGRPESPTVSALAALALADRGAALRALNHAVSSRAPAVGESGKGDRHGRYGWGWTSDTYSWVEPTSRVLLATKILRPSDAATREEAVQLLRERRCPDGGWNYGNATANGVDLRGYAQTTAAALMGLQGEPRDLVGPPLGFLDRRWRDEPGGLTLAQALAAMRLHGDAGVDDVRGALVSAYRRTRFLGNVVALAWAALATAPDPVFDTLRASA